MGKEKGECGVCCDHIIKVVEVQLWKAMVHLLPPLYAFSTAAQDGA